MFKKKNNNKKKFNNYSLNNNSYDNSSQLQYENNSEGYIKECTLDNDYIGSPVINIKNNYLIAILDDYNTICVYNLDDNRLVFKFNTNRDLVSIATSGDNIYAISEDNYLLTFDLNSFQLVSEIDLSKSNTVWSECDISNIFSLKEEGYLLLYCDMVSASNDEDYTAFLLYDTEYNSFSILYKTESELENCIIKGDYVEFTEDDYFIKAEVNVSFNTLNILKKVNVYEDDVDEEYELISDNDELQLKLYGQIKIVKKSDVLVKDYFGNVLFKEKTEYKMPDYYTVSVADKDLLFLFVAGSSKFDIYVFRRTDFSFDLIKRTTCNKFSIEPFSIHDYSDEIGKILVAEENDNKIIFINTDMFM